MTTIEAGSVQFGTERGVWLDSVSKNVEQCGGPLSCLKSWVTGLVYGVEAPAEATYTRFSGQQSQVAFADTIPVQPMQDARRSPLNH